MVVLDRDSVTYTVAVALAAVAGVWGTVDPWLKALFLLSLLDMVAGGVRSMSEGRFSLGIARRGANRKAMMAVLITASLVLQFYVGTESGYNVPLTAAVAGYYAGVEFLSILRHAYAMGIPVPGVLVDMGTKLDKMMKTGGPTGSGGGAA